MTLKKWKAIDSKLHTDNGYWEYRIDRFSIDEGIDGKYHYVHTNGSTMVIPLTAEGKLLLVNQYRYLNRRESIEFPCGGIKTGLSKEENAIKELREETGFSADNIFFLGNFNPFNGVTDELCSLFTAENLIRQPLDSDATEEFQLIEMSCREFETAVANKSIWDGMTIAAYMMFKTMRGDL